MKLEKNMIKLHIKLTGKDLLKILQGTKFPIRFNDNILIISHLEDD